MYYGFPSYFVLYHGNLDYFWTGWGVNSKELLLFRRSWRPWWQLRVSSIRSTTIHSPGKPPHGQQPSTKTKTFTAILYWTAIILVLNKYFIQKISQRIQQLYCTKLSTSASDSPQKHKIITSSLYLRTINVKLITIVTLFPSP